MMEISDMLVVVLEFLCVMGASGVSLEHDGMICI